ncbi:ArsR/SmtB family transcription factor [Pseudonocardia sichuanensis]|uniref:ArsR family transcriptional regulator n=1 Tax=Pseudonocardia kunmingensis TaxID=630975 RepID=A0A543D9W5_9PSEU|nr:metalloregulator ArsR/SmtB family transcription factor [Pseudonocardia kunmingensis]TQM06096.1 ArsR family transcriptional regulator [Pseudonocardia kunmingensis]
MDGGAVGQVRSEAVEAMGDLFRALATPVRLSIVMALSDAPRSVGELVEALGVSQPLVSQHLRVLRAARLVAVDQRQRERVYRLLDDHVRHIVGDAARHVAEHGRRPGVPASG